ncbi:MAG: TonB-dependent receptor [Alphaproteobacteria bacterium HGW-Alphaproteobacteria-17]|nr:MAG: TonB-dependent receptor [Alphaproteobacteria bacterium HGW-Alphaproteobacteria-17]
MNDSSRVALHVRRILGFASLSAMAAVIAAPAMAQGSGPSENSAETAAPEEAIVVTGSRLRGVTPFNSPDPIAVIDPNIASKEGKFDLAATLQSSPIAAGSTQITAAISSNFVTNGGPGAQTIDLRGLGPNRTLVLLNGRRAGPAGTRGGVSSFDLNVLPQSIAENVEILKTGASSVYGSDAVAGVVNIKTKTNTNGLELNGTVSAPFDGGGEEYRVNAVWGKTFSRGHILVAGDYTKINELKRGDRAYLACPEAYTFRPDGSRADIVDPRTGKFMCEDLRWGHVWTYNLIDNLRLDGPGGPNTGLNTSPNGQTVLMQFQYPGEVLGVPTYGAPSFAGDFGMPAGWFPTGYNTASLAIQNAYHPFVEQSTIIPKTERFTAFVDGAFEVSDSLELFGEFLFNRRKTYQNGWRQFWNFGGTSDYLTTFWADGWQGENYLSPTAITDQSDSSQKVDYYRGVAGVRGDFGGASNWRWEAYGQYSKSIGRYRTQQALQDAYDTGYFQTASCVGTVTPVSGKQCVDMRWLDPNFLAGQLTQAEKDFYFDWEEGKTVYTQKSGEATVTGELFKLPAGAVQIALGANIREDRINDVPGEITRAGNAWGASTSGITAGKSLTKEAFGEINVPLLADRPFFDNLTLSAAARVTSVKSTRASDGLSDSDNGNWTYKLGANWALNDTLRFRASYGTSFRAPALFELFLADETSFPSQRSIDPCIQWANNLALGNISQRVADNCAADGIPSNHSGAGVSATATSRGGIGNLRSETSRAMVVGGVLSPKFNFLPDTSINISVDYFDIRVKGEVTQLGARTIVFGCYNSDDFPNDPLCDLFSRGQTAAPNNIAEVRDQFVNIARQRNSGVDVNVNVRHDLGKLGRLSLTADMTWQTKRLSQLLPSSPVEDDNGEIGSPRWVGDFRLSWTGTGGTTLFYGMNVIGGASSLQEFLDRNGDQPCVTTAIRGTYCPKLDTKAVFYHNASITQEVGDRFEITLGVSNLFDTRPPRVTVANLTQNTVPTLGPVAAVSQYGFSGRRGFINVKSKF